MQSLEHTINRVWLVDKAHSFPFIFSWLPESRLQFSSFDATFITSFPPSQWHFLEYFFSFSIYIFFLSFHNTQMHRRNYSFLSQKRIQWKCRKIWKQLCPSDERIVHSPNTVCHKYMQSSRFLSDNFLLNYFGYRWILLFGCRFAVGLALVHYYCGFLFLCVCRLNVRWKFELKISSTPISTRDGPRTRSDLWFVYDGGEWAKNSHFGSIGSCVYFSSDQIIKWIMKMPVHTNTHA